MLLAMALLFRFSFVTDLFYSAMVRDPPRQAPPGKVMVAPADGTVLYVKPVEAGVIPEMVKRGVAVPIADHLKTDPADPPFSGFLIGIYMASHGVHINRAPIASRTVQISVHNGPHMNMTGAEARIILTQLIPGWITLKKLLGLPPFAIEANADYILKSARETIRFVDVRHRRVFVVRIADYFVGRILTWIQEGEQVVTGQKLGMISWGSQTDLLIESSPGLRIEAEVGDYVYGGETVLATYE
ncbi:MAG: phosphatidylserine decarboxylase [Magnetococcales bacterium]|nr:phosphatidylserine decarboxylase [Magnetococcales bacterium]